MITGPVILGPLVPLPVRLLGATSAHALRDPVAMVSQRTSRMELGAKNKMSVNLRMKTGLALDLEASVSTTTLSTLSPCICAAAKRDTTRLRVMPTDEL